MYQHKFIGPWCHLLRFHLDRHKKAGTLTRMNFTHRIGMTEQMVNAYLVGRSRPPLDRVELMADVLSLTGTERETFLFQANQHYTPISVWEQLGQLTALHKVTQDNLTQRQSDITDLRAINADMRAELVQLRILAIDVAKKATRAPNQMA